MSVPAWQRREYERQEILRALTRKMHMICIDRGYDDIFYLALVECILESLKETSSPPEELRDSEFDDRTVSAQFGNAQEEAEIFFYEVHERLDRFARSVEEKDALLAIFLAKHVLGAAFSRLHRVLSRQEIEDPRTIFHTSSRTTEVDIGEPSLGLHPADRERKTIP